MVLLTPDFKIQDDFTVLEPLKFTADNFLAFGELQQVTKVTVVVKVPL